MSQDFEQTGGELEEIEIPEEPLTESEKEYERTIERLDNFFAGLTPGVTLLVERLRPSWCSGMLEEFTIGDEAIGLDYFIDTWGGELLSVKVRGKKGQLRGSYKIPLHTFPPLRYGEPIRPNNRGDRFRDEPSSAPAPAAPVVVQSPSGFSADKVIGALSGIAPFFLQWMKAQEDKRQNDLAMMMTMMKANQNTGGIADITKLGSAMAQLQQLFKDQSGGGDGGGNEMDFIPHALDVLKMVLQPGQQQQPQRQPAPAAPRGRLTTGRPSGPPPSRMAPTAPGPGPAKVTPLNPPRDIAQSISDMNPKAAAETLIEAIGRMNPDKRDQAIGHFLAEYQATMGGDDDYEDDFEGDTDADNEQETRGVR